MPKSKRAEQDREPLGFEDVKSAHEPIRWLILGPVLTIAALGFVVVFLFSAYLVWSSTSGPGWLYLTIPAASLILGGAAALIAYLAGKRTRPALLAGGLTLFACDLAAGVVILQQPFLF